MRHGSDISLAEKYQPTRLADLLGQGFARHRLEDFVAAPRPRAFLFSGPKGLGKSSAGLCIANELHCHPTIGYWVYDAAKFTDADMDYLESTLRYSPMGGGWRVIQIDEADWLTRCPKIAARWKTLLVSHPVRTVFVFTTNHVDKFDSEAFAAFMDRVEHIPFESDCRTLWADAEQLVARIWFEETGRCDWPALADLIGTCETLSGISFRSVVQSLETRLPIAKPFVLTAPPEAPKSLFQAAAERQRIEPTPTTARPDFDCLVRSVLIDGKRTLGNVDFWIDADGPWAGSLSYSIPTEKWVGVQEALTLAIKSPAPDNGNWTGPATLPTLPPLPDPAPAPAPIAKPRPESSTAMLRRLNAYLDDCTSRPSEQAVADATGLSWSFARRHVLKRFPDPAPIPVAEVDRADVATLFDWSDYAELAMSGAC